LFKKALAKNGGLKVKKGIVFLSILVGLIFKVSCVTEKRLVGYYPNWLFYGKDLRPKFSPQDIKVNHLTHLNYAFAKPVSVVTLDKIISGEKQYNLDELCKEIVFDSWADTDASGGNNYRNAIDLKNKNSALKVLISIGGWTLSKEFTAIAVNSERRDLFAKIMTDFAQKYHFD